MVKDELITLGSYPYTENGEKRPIEWQVLHVAEDCALLLSRYALDAQPKFQKSKNAEEKHEKAEPGVPRFPAEGIRLLNTPYEQSWLHDWLNGDFLQQAFTEQERSWLLEAEDSTHAGQGNLGRVFVLGKEDIDDAELFPSDLSTGCIATPYAKSKYIDDIEENRQESADRPYGECASWWLRDSGFVVWGGNAQANGIICMRMVFTEPLAVRPAILLDLKAYEKAKSPNFLAQLFGKKEEPRFAFKKVQVEPLRVDNIECDGKQLGRTFKMEEATAAHGAKFVFIPEGINQQSVELVSKPNISKQETDTLMTCFGFACAGVGEMQMNLASLYWSGKYVPQSYEESVRWDRYAVNQGNASAMVDLAECYNKGLGGLPKDDEKAFDLAQRAAEQGLSHAMKMLAVCYEEGIGTDVDLLKASEWMQKAEEAEKAEKSKKS